MPKRDCRLDQLTEGELESIRRLHAEGYSQNKIAKMIGRSQQSVSKYAEQMGLKFDGTQHTEPARKARLARIQERRMQLAEDLMDDVERIRERLSEPYLDHAFVGGKNGAEYVEHELPEVPSKAAADLSRAMSSLIQAVDKVTPDAIDDGAAAAVSMLGMLATGLKAKLAEDESDDDSGD